MAIAPVAHCLHTLPADDSASATSGTAPRRKIKVVLVDDEPSILKTWKAILEAHDFEVVACERAPEALSAILAGCDCVLTDYHMPDMTGIELILAAKPHTKAHFIVMTGNDSSKLRSAATTAGAVSVLAKPAPIKSVLEIIEKLCTPPL